MPGDTNMFSRTVYVMAFFATVVLFCSGSFVDPAEAKRALETQGYSSVVLKDHKWFLVGWRGCSGGDAARFDATAVNPVGKKVNIFVCAGWPFKGATIRSE